MLPFEQYLYVLSRGYLFAYRRGWLRSNPYYQYPYFVPKLLRKGDTVIDIGANLGYYTTVFAEAVGKSGQVIAVEPVTPVRRVLERNTKQYPQVRILPYALGTEDKPIALGNDTLTRDGYVASGSHYVLDRHNTEASSAEVEFDAEMRRASTLFADLERVDFIKIDIEGYETVVMPELRGLLERHFPIVLMETNGSKRVEMLRYMKELSYTPYILKEGNLIPPREGDESDVLFMPALRAGTAILEGLL